MPVDTAREIFEVHMPKRFSDDPGASTRVNATYKFVLTGEEPGIWLVDLTRSPATVSEEDAEAECTITVASSDFLDIVHGRLSGQGAFMRGKLEVEGDKTLALKLGSVLGR